MPTVTFGEQRLRDPARGAADRLLFRMFGIPDPAHYLHSLYFRRALDRYVATPPRRILDAGCGRGDYSVYLAQRYLGAEVLGVDIRPEYVDRDQRVGARLGVGNLRFEVADLAARRWPGAFDLIATVDVLEHIPAQQQAFANLADSLAPGGILFAHIPCRRPRPTLFSRYLREFHRWAEQEHTADERTAEEFVAMFEACGLRIRSWQPTFGRWTGELATSLFNLPYRNTPLNRVFQLSLLAPCRMLAALDPVRVDRVRYAVAIVARRPPDGANEPNTAKE